MTIDNQKPGQSLGKGLRWDADHETRATPADDFGPTPIDAVDFAFLAGQTFGDTTLEREVLELFVAQSRKILSRVPGMTAKEQADTGHLLKGSARGIGAWAAAEAADRFETASPDSRHLLFPDLARAFAATERAIDGRLAILGG